MTIKALSLINFQSHKQTHIDFSPGVNVIVGPSRNGKTCLLRALRWVIENRPSGDEFRSHWAGKENTEVKIRIDDSQIVRVKGNNSNFYVLDTCSAFPGGAPQRLEGFGQDVPKPISEALNIDPALNCQYQFDQPFLLFDSPGQVAKALNKVVHLDVIDRAMANIGSLKRSNDRDIQAQESRLSELKELEAGFPDLEAAEEFISELEQTEKDLQAKALRLERLKVIQIQIQELRLSLALVRLPAEVEVQVSRLNEIKIEKNSKLDRMARANNLQCNILTIRSYLTQIQIPAETEAKLSKLESTQAKKAQLEYTKELLISLQARIRAWKSQIQALAPALGQEAWLSELLTKNRMLDSKRKALARVRGLQEQIARARLGVIQKLAIIKVEDKDYDRLWPGKCPLCGK